MHERLKDNSSKVFKSWERYGRYHLDINSPRKTTVRENVIKVPSNNARRSFPILRMVVTNQRNFAHSNGYKNLNFEIYLEDLEYNIKTSYGNNYSSLEQAKFIADLRLIDLGYRIIDPYLL